MDVDLIPKTVFALPTWAHSQCLQLTETCCCRPWLVQEHIGTGLSLPSSPLRERSNVCIPAINSPAHPCVTAALPHFLLMCNLKLAGAHFCDRKVICSRLDASLPARTTGIFICR